jgi:hypothetical protein
LSDDDLNTIAIDVGINIGTFASCRTDGSQEDEVKQDVAVASVAGATDTPTFFIGKSTDDITIKGERLVGAQPYPAFQPVILKFFRIEIKGACNFHSCHILWPVICFLTPCNAAVLPGLQFGYSYYSKVENRF